MYVLGVLGVAQEAEGPRLLSSQDRAMTGKPWALSRVGASVPPPARI